MQFDRLELKDFATLGVAGFGFLAFLFGPESYWTGAALILVAAVLDAVDGKLARAQKTANDFGRELDSLSDAVAFGAAPPFLVLSPFWNAPWPMNALHAAAAIVFLSAVLIRLARFNLYSLQNKPSGKRNEKQKKSVYYGLPSPAAALVLVAIAPFFGPLVPLLELGLAALMLSNFEIKKPGF